MDLYISFSKSGDFYVGLQIKTLVRAAILATLDHEGFPYNADVSVIFADNEYIHALNKEFRNVDKPTDVLSFPMFDGEFPSDECIPSASLGDIVISLERAAEQARELGHSVLREVAFLAIHSTLHLLGYDHERSEEDDEAQCTAQREIVELLCID